MQHSQTTNYIGVIWVLLLVGYALQIEACGWSGARAEAGGGEGGAGGTMECRYDVQQYLSRQSPRSQARLLSFSSYDRRNTGRVTLWDIQATIPAEIPRCVTVQLFRDADANGDGTVDCLEHKLAKFWLPEQRNKISCNRPGQAPSIRTSRNPFIFIKPASNSRVFAFYSRNIRQ
ncbi:PREDICTED: uncharacterized protein LOC106806900 [Priapulus caudatus]|uniref:Uncharacterized protein LOC106806900 n=1 Tax=Priapulus caudatus TaxID=37621 RepID=A0ABM1DX60_PRICU|nr:PREDICTED: uncharacterized protein LOC106806900 [Priapulus caudatus]